MNKLISKSNKQEQHKMIKQGHSWRGGTREHHSVVVSACDRSVKGRKPHAVLFSVSDTKCLISSYNTLPIAAALHLFHFPSFPTPMFYHSPSQPLHAYMDVLFLKHQISLRK